MNLYADITMFFMNENNEGIAPSDKIRDRMLAMHNEILKKGRNGVEYTTEEEIRMLDRVTVNRGSWPLDLTSPCDRAFLELVNTTEKIILWNTEYVIVDRSFKADSPRALYIVLKEI